jgi:branched-chain amino acid transport system substrate-binding protein
MIRGKTRLLVASGVVLGLAVAGCSTKNDTTGTKSSAAGPSAGASSAGGTSAASGGGTTRGVTATTIKVGGLSTLKPPGGQPPFPGLNDGAKARFERANRDGELKHKIDFIGTTDDAADQTRNAQGSKQLVLNDKVFAVVPFVTQVAAGSGQFLNTQKVPFIGWGFTPSSCTEYGLGDTGCIGPGADKLDLSLSKPLATALGGGAGKTAVVFSENYAGSDQNAKNMVHAIEGAGFKVVLSDDSLPPDTAGPVTDFSPYVQKVMTANNGQPPDLMVNNTNFNNAVGFTGALTAAGFKGHQVNYVAYVPGLLEAAPDLAKALNGTYLVQQGTGAQAFGGKSWDQITSDLKAINAPTSVGLGTVHGYASADMFVQAIKQLETDGKDITAENFASLFTSGWTYPGLGNAIGQAVFPQAKTSANNCSSMVQVEGTKYVPVVDLKCGYGLAPIPK